MSVNDIELNFEWKTEDIFELQMHVWKLIFIGKYNCTNSSSFYNSILSAIINFSESFRIPVNGNISNFLLKDKLLIKT